VCARSGTAHCEPGGGAGTAGCGGGYPRVDWSAPCSAPCGMRPTGRRVEKSAARVRIVGISVPSGSKTRLSSPARSTPVHAQRARLCARQYTHTYTHARARSRVLMRLRLRHECNNILIQRDTSACC